MNELPLLPRPINRAAITYVRQRCRQAPLLHQSDAHLYVLVAIHTPHGRTTSLRLPLQEYAALMRCDSKTVKRAVDRLSALEELAVIDGGQGQRVIQFDMVRLAGPLYVAARAASDEPRSNCPKASDYMTEVLQSHCPKLPAATRTSVHRSTTISNEQEQLDQATRDNVSAYLNWWQSEYPAHNGGALYKISKQDRADIAELMAVGYTLERLQAMAIAFWKMAPDVDAESDQTWLATRPVRSVHLLHYKSPFIDRYTRGLTSAPAAATRGQSGYDSLAEKTAKLLASLDAQESAV